MRKKSLKSFMLLLLLAVGVSSVFAEDVSITFTDASGVNQNGITITAAKGNGNSTAPAWNDNSSEWRVYATGTLTIKATRNITKIVYDYNVNKSSKQNIAISGASGSTNAGTWDEGTKTWTGSDTEVVFTSTGSSGNVGFKSVVITLEDSGSEVTVADPVFNPAAGAVAYGTNVSITSEGAHMVVYTTDNSEPTWDNGKDIDNNPITITGNVTIKARAFDKAQNASNVVTAEYTVIRPDAPTFSPAAGAVAEGTEVTLSAANGMKIIYTTDGTEPSYSPSNGTVFASGDVITINEAMTIKAIAVQEISSSVFFESEVAEAAYTIYDPNGPGTMNNPYTIAQARAAIDANEGITGVYAKGIVSEIVTAYSSQYGNITYNISEDGSTTAAQLQSYRGKSYNGDSFTSKDDIQVGDEVVIYGNLTTYGDIYEFAANNQLVSLNRKEKADATIVFKVDGKEVAELEMSPDDMTEIEVVCNVEDAELTYSSSDNTVAEYDEGYILSYAEGTATITATFDGNDDYKAATATLVVNVADNRADAGLEWSDKEVKIALNAKEGDYKLPTLTNPNNVNVTYKSSNEEVAIVENGEFAVATEELGSAIITASFAGDQSYKPAEASFTITIYDPTLVSAEVFAKVTSTDDLADGDYLIVYEEGGLAFNGGLETLDAVSNTVSVTITDGTIAANDDTKAAIFTYDATNKTLKSASGLYIGQTSDANGLACDATKTYENTISFDDEGNANIISGGTYMRFNAASNQNRFRYYKSSSYSNQKAVQLYRLTENAAVPVSITAAGMATFSSTKALDFTNVEEIYAYTATITDNNIAFTRIMKIPANTGVLIRNPQGESAVEVNVPVLTGEAEAVNGNAFVAVSEDIESLPSVFESNNTVNYILNKVNGKLGFYKANGKKVAAGKAYLNVRAAAAKGFFGFGEDVATGIESIEHSTLSIEGSVYNMQGQRVAQPTKGLYIVNGKKCIIK